MTLKYIKETLENKGYRYLDCRKLESIKEILIYKINNPDIPYSNEYFASFVVEKSKIFFNEKFYKTVEDFIKAAEEYNSTLKYPMYCYDKSYNENYRVIMKVYHYVENVLNFKRVDVLYDKGRLYSKKYGIANKIEFRITDNLHDIDNAGSLFFQLSGGWSIDEKFKTEDEAISIINGFIEAENLCILAEGLNTLESIQGDINFNLDMYKFNYGNLSVDKSNFKDIVREHLKNALEKIG